MTMQGSYDSLAALEAAERELAAPFLDENTARGAFYRAQPLKVAFRKWLIEEGRRGCPGPCVVEAAMQIFGGIVGNIVEAMSDNAGMTREKALAIFFGGLAHHAEHEIAAPPDVVINTAKQ
jgi:hypothetical protein